MEISELLERATLQIEDCYFHVETAGNAQRRFRERVYCYELYHQLRVLGFHLDDLTVSGEVDKTLHPDFGMTKLNRLKPDLIIHQPGSHSHNYAVIEVKRIVAERRALTRDIEKLYDFCAVGHYQIGLLLLYGNGPRSVTEHTRRLRSIFNAFAAQKEESTSRKLQIWWHQNSGSPATRVR